MKAKIIKALGAVLICFGMIGAMTVPVFADDVFCTQEGLSPAAQEAMGCSTSTSKLPNTIVNIIDFVIGVGGLVAVIYIVIGGYNYMTSQGDSTKLQKAKSTILYAVIGLFVCILAFSIVNFALTGLKSTTDSTIVDDDDDDDM